MRRYPLDDRATGTGDDGERLPTDILTDCHIRFPNTAGNYAFLSGITVTGSIVTLVFLAAETPTAAGGFTPLASVTLQQPVEEGINYPVTPLFQGVGGFIAFGDVSESFVGRFSTPQQGLVSLKCARPYKVLPIPTLRAMGRDVGLEGVVTLKAGTDIEILKQTADIDVYDQPLGPYTRDVITIRLLQNPGEANVLARYIGECDVRPESRNCLKDGIESINEAIPDCNGNIEIVFRHLTEGPFSSCGGTTLDHGVNLTDACESRDPEQFPGHDQCVPSASSSSSSSLGSPPSLPSLPSSSSSSGSLPLEPWCLGPEFCFNFDAVDAGTYVRVVSGDEWVFTAEDSPDESCDSLVSLSSLSFDSSSGSSMSSSSAVTWTWADPVPIPYIGEAQRSLASHDLSQRCIALLNYGCNLGDGSALDKELSTDLKFLADNPLDQNAGIIANYRIVDVLINPHLEFFYVEVDRKNRRLRLWFFPGAGPFTLVGEVRLKATIIKEHWYRLKLRIEEHPTQSQTVVLTATLSGVTNPTWPVVQIQAPTNRYLPADGVFGMCTERTKASFSYIAVRGI
jgi:hypothetical protein